MLMHVRKVLLFVLIPGALFFGCGDKEEADKAQKEPGAFEAFSALKKMSEEADRMEKEGKALENVTPLDDAALKSVFPDDFGGLPRKKLTVGNAMSPGLAMANAEYYETPEGSVKLSVTDGAGEAGSALAGLIRLRLAADVEKEDENGYEKSCRLDGEKGIEAERRTGEGRNGELTFLVGNRFWLNLEGRNVDAARLKQMLEKERTIRTLQTFAE